MKQDSHIEVMKDLQGFFKPTERQKIYNSCESWRDRVLIRLLWKSGRRISEILQIKVKDINFQDGLILWVIIKKKKHYKKWKPIDKLTLELLNHYITEGLLKQDHYLLHAGYPERPISRQRAFQIVRRLCRKAGIHKVGDKLPHPHHFRHSFAIDVAKKSKSAADIRKVQQLLEHSSLAMTEQYLQFGDSDARDLIEED
jgi:integrase/recombinase XerD